jgi:hypothetical protein
METVPAGVELSFEVTYDSSGLPVAMSVYNTEGESPVLVQGPTAMTNVVGSTYVGKFTPSAELNYLIFKAVYTDDTFETIDTDFVAGTETIYAADSGGGGGGTSDCGTIIGFVNDPVLIGLVTPNNPIVGIVCC